MTSQQQLVNDSSTDGNFQQWAGAIAAFFSTAGWTQSGDTGQSTFSSATKPGSGVFLYQIWQPGDAGTTFYVKLELGNVSGTNSPSIKLTISTSTNGTGTPTGIILGPVNVNCDSYTASSSSTQYECNFSGSNNRMCIMMWRNGLNNCQQMFAIERSVDSAGSYTNDYVTLYTAGLTSGGGNAVGWQGTLVFGVNSFAPGGTHTSSTVTNNCGWMVRTLAATSGSASSAFNGGIGFDTAAPYIGYFDYSGTAVGTANAGDVVEAVTFTVTIYGSTRTYMPSKTGRFGFVGMQNFSGTAAGILCMRYD